MHFKKRKSVTDSFENWLQSVPYPKNKNLKEDGSQKSEIIPKKTDHVNPSKEFLTWLDEQL